MTQAQKKQLEDIGRRVLVLETSAENHKERIGKLETAFIKLDDTLDAVNNKLSYWSGAIGLGAFIAGYFISK